MPTIEQAVDERCRAKCTALAQSITRCETERGPNACKTEFSAWRSYCVTNSACNPSGKQVDPMRAERKCAALAKRVQICEASITNVQQQSATADCVEQRRRWNELCSGVNIHEVREPDPESRTQAITQQYKEAPPPPPPPEAGPLLKALASRLSSSDTLASRLCYLMGDHPAVAIMTLAGTLSACVLLRQQPPGVVTGAQRLMAGRVYVQGAVVASTALVLGVAEVVAESRR